MAKPPLKRPAHRPEHIPGDKDRLTVKVMVAGGIEQVHIAGVIGISRPTLRKWYKRELAVGATEINGLVVAEHIKRIRAGDFKAIEWWEKSRMGWRETTTVENVGKDGRPIEQIVTYRWADTPKAE